MTLEANSNKFRGNLDVEGYKEEMRGMNVMKAGRRVAPHKAVMLLAVVELIERGEIDSPFVPITPSLERTFRRIWSERVGEGRGFNCNMYYPFYHLHTSSFWELVKLPGYEEDGKVTSMTALRRRYAGAVLARELFEALREERVRREVRVLLADCYLPDASERGYGIGAALMMLAAMFVVA